MDWVSFGANVGTVNSLSENEGTCGRFNGGTLGGKKVA